MGLNTPKAQDKEWATVDFSNNNIYCTWTQFYKYGSSLNEHKTNILFSKSEDAGVTWFEPKQINSISGNCIDEDNTAEGAVPAVGPNGEIYVAWSLREKIYFNKSYNKGETWLGEERQIAEQPGGWSYTIPGISRANGLPITCCDTSNSNYRGNIYVNWSDQRNGETNTDIWLIKSNDGGETWSQAKRVNDDNSNKHQFLTWMTIDQTTGYLYFVFYDRRKHVNEATDVYVAMSKDGGETFTNNKISETPFFPTSSVFFGDYTNISAHNGVIRPIWTRLDTSSLSIWTALIEQENVFIYNNPLIENSNYPNPVQHKSYYSFKLRSSANVSLSLHNIYGQTIKQIITNKKLDQVKYIEMVDVESTGLSLGIYFYRFICDDKTSIQKIIIRK